MDVTALPTDSVIKFLAVGSVLLMGFLGWRLNYLVTLDHTKRKQALAIELSKAKLAHANEDLASVPASEVVAKRKIMLNEIRLRHDELELHNLQRQMKYNTWLLFVGFYLALSVGAVSFHSWSKDEENDKFWKDQTLQEREAKTRRAEYEAQKARVDLLLLNQEHPIFMGQLVPSEGLRATPGSSSSAHPPTAALASSQRTPDSTASPLTH